MRNSDDERQIDFRPRYFAPSARREPGCAVPFFCGAVLGVIGYAIGNSIG
jgi:hypothetical protein